MKRPAFIAILRRLREKRERGEITPKQYADRKTSVVTARIVFQETRRKA